ncbi:MAG: molecular chaperone TorD family protein [Hyphomicrobiaceae bacterium]|nr:molecular chaperone TorD family protein [Hyphomicrobiaceae bacterium]
MATGLSAPLSAEKLAVYTGLSGDTSPLGSAIGDLAGAARSSDLASLDDAYHALFIGIGRGELLPFGSYYLAGFLHEKPLARLRQAMRELAIMRDPAVREPEDHIASVLEMMAGLIDGQFGDGRSGQPAELQTQKGFFDAHVVSWAPHFFRDLSRTTASPFYAAIGRVGDVFLAIEKEAFDYV